MGFKVDPQKFPKKFFYLLIENKKNIPLTKEYKENGMPKKYIELGDGRRTLDLTGQRYNRLTFISYEGRYRTSAVWMCRCDCGRSITTVSNNVKSGNTKHCGCLSSPSTKKKQQKAYYHKDAKILTICNIIGWSKEFVQSKDFKPYAENWWKSKRKKYYPWTCQCGCGNKIKIQKRHIDKFIPLYYQDHGNTYYQGGVCEDLTGQKYNRLKFIEFVKRTKTRTFWKCLCDCGEYTITDANSVKRGTTKSCGCVRVERMINLGGDRSKITKEDDTGWWQIDFDVKPKKSRGKTYYWGSCTYCGITQKWVYSYYLRNGLSRSCGCINEGYRKIYESGPHF